MFPKNISMSLKKIFLMNLSQKMSLYSKYQSPKQGFSGFPNEIFKKEDTKKHGVNFRLSNVKMDINKIEKDKALKWKVDNIFNFAETTKY